MPDTHLPQPIDIEAARERRVMAQHLQAIEGNPLDADDVAMFEMFERERWPHDRRLAYITQRVNRMINKG
jgi:hypothetical protein